MSDNMINLLMGWMAESGATMTVESNDELAWIATFEVICEHGSKFETRMGVTKEVLEKGEYTDAASLMQFNNMCKSFERMLSEKPYKYLDEHDNEVTTSHDPETCGDYREIIMPSCPYCGHEMVEDDTPYCAVYMCGCIDGGECERCQ